MSADGPVRTPIPFALTLGLARGLDLLTRRESLELAGPYREWLALVLGGDPRRVGEEETLPSVAAQFLHALWFVIAVVLALGTLPFLPPGGEVSGAVACVLALGACVGVVNAGLGYLTDHGAARLARHPLFTPLWVLTVAVLYAIVLATIVF